MQEKTIKELRQELKEQIKENQELIAEIKELNVDNEWWNNRYKAQVRINEEHQKLNGELRKEIDGLVTVIDLAKGYINKNKRVVREIHSLNGDSMEFYELCIDPDELLEILERVNEIE